MLTEIVLVDDAGIKITTQGIQYNSSISPELEFRIENNSGKDLEIFPSLVLVNGYVYDDLFTETLVPSGERITDKYYFSFLEGCNIDTIAEIEISFSANENIKGITRKYYSSKPVKIKNYTTDTYTYSYDDSGEVVYDANGIKIVSKGIVESSHDLYAYEHFPDLYNYTPNLQFYIYNSTDKDIAVKCDCISVNEYVTMGYMDTIIKSGTHALPRLRISFLDIEKNDITSVESIEFSLDISNYGTEETIANIDNVSLTFTK